MHHRIHAERTSRGVRAVSTDPPPQHCLPGHHCRRQPRRTALCDWSQQAPRLCCSCQWSWWKLRMEQLHRATLGWTLGKPVNTVPFAEAISCLFTCFRGKTQLFPQVFIAFGNILFLLNRLKGTDFNCCIECGKMFKYFKYNFNRKKKHCETGLFFFSIASHFYLFFALLVHLEILVASSKEEWAT